MRAGGYFPLVPADLCGPITGVVMVEHQSALGEAKALGLKRSSGKVEQGDGGSAHRQVTDGLLSSSQKSPEMAHYLHTCLQTRGEVSQIAQTCQSQGTHRTTLHLSQPALTATSLFGSSQVLGSLLKGTAKAPMAQQGSPRRASHVLLAGACAAYKICTKIPPRQCSPPSLAQEESSRVPPRPHLHSQSERQQSHSIRVV